MEISSFSEEVVELYYHGTIQEVMESVSQDKSGYNNTNEYGSAVIYAVNFTMAWMIKSRSYGLAPLSTSCK